MTSQNPLVSVIVTYYNEDDCIKYALESIINQTYQNIEVIIINDSACKERERKINKIVSKINKKNIRVIHNHKNIGVAASRNIGIKTSSGTIIFFLDADDIFKKNKIKIQTNIMTMYGYHMTYTNYRIKNSIFNLRESFRSIYRYNLNTMICFSSTAFSKEYILEKQLFFLEDRNIQEDLLFICDILKETKCYLASKEILTIRNVRANSLNSNKLLANIKRINTYKKMKIKLPYLVCAIHNVAYVVRYVKATLRGLISGTNL